MAKTYHIEPFPFNIDRDKFGHYISGFVDGEGSFGLCQYDKGKYFLSKADFFLGVRADDIVVLKLIQSYWQCGSIYIGKPNISVKNANPLAAYRIQRANELVKIVVPHFEKYPLYAKKKRDFEIWKEGVKLQYQIKTRKYRMQPVGKGRMPQWTQEDMARFTYLINSLRDVRIYNSTPAQISSRQPDVDDRVLFEIMSRKTEC